MAFYDFFRNLCQQQICWERMTGRDNYGKPTYAAAKSYYGRRVNKVTRVASFSRAVKGEGVEFLSMSQIWILPVEFGTGDVVSLPAVSYDDRVYVSGDTLYPPVLAVDSSPDQYGTDQYVKISLGNANG